ncbi:hypothetical protein PoB_005231600 [Plakobranchus ocellatus]|uniref:CTLH domain-containing protein n=1 Tax=Plakobranchus ocellatus TaxID=259542 RepID=A0AAV4BRD3_9GAST|nr:hypothetical protein PoB_005231600 [Plakobranchus ocellatus]
MKLSKSSAPDFVKELKGLLEDDASSALFFQKMTFIKEKRKLFVEALDIFQSQQPLALKYVRTLCFDPAKLFNGRTSAIQRYFVL